MESFEFPGVWWIPTDCEHTKFYGPLQFDPKSGGKLSLTFDKSMSDHPIMGNTADKYIPLIHGKMDGRKVTLTKCRKTYPHGQNRDKERDAFTMTAIVKTATVILGAHFDSLRDIEFAWMSASFTSLDEWMGGEITEFDDQGYARILRRNPTGVMLHNGTKIVFQRSNYEEVGASTVPYPEIMVATVIPDGNMRFTVCKSEDGMDAVSYFQYIDCHLRDFLAFATGTPTYPFNVFGKTAFEAEQYIRIYYQIPGYDPAAHRRVEASFTFQYEFVESRLPTLLNNWIEFSKTMRSVCELYFKRYYISNVDNESQFQILVQAAEAYHRRKYGDTYLECYDYIHIEELLHTEISKIVKTSEIELWAHGDVDKDNVNALKQKLMDLVSYGNEFSLRRRLKGVNQIVARENKEVVDRLLENPNEFIDRVTNTRNSLAHGLDEQGSGVLSQSDYPGYLIKMRKLLRLCFLVEIGLTADEIDILSQYYPMSTI